MILAAGLGTRMRPLTNHLPKPLLFVAGKPLIVWHVERLKQAGIVDIVINLAWKGEKIRQYLGNGKHWGVNIAYSDEQPYGALETAGGIRQALHLLGDKPFIVVNGDIWCDYDYSKLFLPTQSKGHIVLVANPPHNTSGDFALKGDWVKNKAEKKFTFSGIGYYCPSLFTTLSEGKRKLAPVIRQAIDRQQITGEYFQGTWHDIGTPERLYALSNRLFTNKTTKY